ncbi:hypothetical protein [Caballeronia sp. ATUFL_M2_KS44]|uniref:hypothetical protein n=1 Tax=Caballeronia sp. ATUFL_M2_KS44 TaxID=2921767 RepID=UPI00202958BE|nr:hypothetical protein [Caballeronia sp. ATUFL_M2_KS44]
MTLAARLTQIVRRGGLLLVEWAARRSPPSVPDAAAPRHDDAEAGDEVDPVALGIDRDVWDAWRREGAPAHWIAHVARSAPSYLRAGPAGGGTSAGAHGPLAEGASIGRRTGGPAGLFASSGADAAMPNAADASPPPRPRVVRMLRCVEPDAQPRAPSARAPRDKARRSGPQRPPEASDAPDTREPSRTAAPASLAAQGEPGAHSDAWRLSRPRDTASATAYVPSIDMLGESMRASTVGRTHSPDAPLGALAPRPANASARRWPNAAAAAGHGTAPLAPMPGLPAWPELPELPELPARATTVRGANQPSALRVPSAPNAPNAPHPPAASGDPRPQSWPDPAPVALHAPAREAGSAATRDGEAPTAPAYKESAHATGRWADLTTGAVREVDAWLRAQREARAIRDLLAEQREVAWNAWHS